MGRRAGGAVIRFSCAHCNRAYVLADALAHLPLLCKGCGQALVVPDPQPEPVAPPTPPPTPPTAPPPPPVAAPKPPVPPPPPVPPLRLAAPSGTPSDPDIEELLSSEALSGLEWQEVPRPAPPPEVPAPITPAQQAPAPPEEAPNPARRLLGKLLDGVVGLILFAVGAMVGEYVAEKPTREILESAGSAPKFPPLDLLIWLGSAAGFVLIYVWLGTRGWTVGCWLRRRAA